MLTLLFALTLAQETPMTDETAEEAEMAPIVLEEHLWLEEVQGERALETVRRWNAATVEAFADDPNVAAFEAEALEILTSDARIPKGRIRGKYYDVLWRDAEHVRGQWRRTRVKDFVSGEPEWDVILDLDALDAEEQENWIWHGASCHDESDRCMVDLSRGGTDASVHREFDLVTRTFVDGGFFVPEAKSDVTWLDEDTLLVGTDRGEGTLTDSGYPRTVVRWGRGTELSEAPVVFEGEAQDVASSAWVAHHGKDVYPFFLRSVTFYESEIHYAPEGADPVQLPLPRRFWPLGVFKGQLLVVLNEDHLEFATGTLISLDLETMALDTVFAPVEGQAIEDVAIGKKALTVQLLDNVVGRLVRLKPKGGAWVPVEIPLPDNGVVSIEASSSSSDDVLVSFESLTVPTTLFHVDKKDGVHEVMSMPAFYDASDVVVEQRFAESSDGTQVPYFLMARRDVLEGGPAPTIQYGYGGFLAAILPNYFSESARPQHGAVAGKTWVSRGGVLVLSNIRGGSEYGPNWHSSVLKHDRQLAYDDFFAIAEDLVPDGVTTPEQLGAIGRSNGGLLMGVAFTQRPDLYAAIDCGVPLLDMLRYHTLLAGASWMGEYGNPEIPEDRAVLEAYSPYQNVREGVEYPSILFYTSTLDDRVHPGHARRMAARLEQLGVPFEYMENIEGGHGGVANQQQSAHRLAMEFAFMARELGLSN